jgi:flagellar hook assembly protein FlgD
MELKPFPIKITVVIFFSFFCYQLNFGATSFDVVYVDVTAGGSTTVTVPTVASFTKAIKSIATSGSQVAITYSVRSNDAVKIAVYDLQGVLIQELLHEQQKSGLHRAVWNGNNSLGSQVRRGIYLLKIVQGKEKDSAIIVMGK